jgi:hypothetical protein
MRNALINTFILCLVSPAAAMACQMATLPELVARGGTEPVVRNIVREFVPVPVSELSRQADLVIDGDVQAIRTYLSNDECYVLTDYLLTPRAMVAGMALQSTQPGPRPLVVTLVGGATTIDGVQVVVRDEQLPLIPSGSRVMLFLQPSARDKDKFELVGAVSGAFALSADDRVSPLVQGAGPDYITSIPSDRARFVEQVRHFSRSRPPR